MNGRPYKVGDWVRILLDTMGNKAGTVGIVFETYRFDGDMSMPYDGISIIFPNGEWCGWGVDEFGHIQKVYEDVVEKHKTYRFRNASQVNADFRAGFWTFLASENVTTLKEKLRECITEGGALARQDPAKYARRRFEQINAVLEMLIADIPDPVIASDDIPF